MFETIQEIDGIILVGIQQSLHADWLTPVMKLITLFGEGGIFWIACCLLMMFFPKTRRMGIICSASMLITFICCNIIIKPAVDRTRPWVILEEVIRLLEPPGDASFPSGHSANAMGPAWAMFMSTLPVKVRIRNAETGKVTVRKDYDAVPCLGWKGTGVSAKRWHVVSIAAVILACLIGFSRLYLGMHFPSDVICGLLLGMTCATIVHFIITKIESSRGIIGGKSV